MFYIFHGDEEFVRSEAVARLRAQIVQDGMGDLNITVLDGRTVTLGEIINACSTVPFLTNRRLIIVKDLLQRFEAPRRSRGRSRDKSSPPAGEPEYAEKLLAYLPHLPDTTRLIFVEGRLLKRSNPLLAQAQDIPGSYIREFKSPASGKLHRWIQQRAKDKGVTITRESVSLLISFIGEDLRLLDQELEKLAAHVNYVRPIKVGDVKALVSAAQESNIFALVDSLGLRNRGAAMRQLQVLLADGANELYLLAMIARQVRLILSVKDLAEQGKRSSEIRRESGISHQFILDKLLRQARRFEAEELESIMRRMLEIDQAIKTGRIKGSLALELLALEICHRRPGATAESPG